MFAKNERICLILTLMFYLSFRKINIPHRISEKTQGPFIVKYINSSINQMKFSYEFRWLDDQRRPPFLTS